MPIDEVKAHLDIDPTQIALDSVDKRLDSLATEFHEFRRDFNDRQDRARRGQWPIFIAAVGVVVSIGALVAAGFYRDIGRLEEQNKAMIELLDVWRDRVAAVASKADRADRVSSANADALETERKLNQRRYESTLYRMGDDQ